jgi:Pyridoxamine 5'-phosphate oxidase
MDLDRAREFLRENHRGVLATRRASGIQQSPVLMNLDGEGDARSSEPRERAYKVADLRRDPWAQACVFTNRFFGQWL